MFGFFKRNIEPQNKRLGKLLAETLLPPMHIKIVDHSTTQSIYVRTFCNHVVQAGECVKCQIVIEDDPREYEDE